MKKGVNTHEAKPRPISRNKPKRQLGAYGDSITTPLPGEILDLFDRGNTRTKKKK
jgi:hypothetical protein